MERPEFDTKRAEDSVVTQLAASPNSSKQRFFPDLV